MILNGPLNRLSDSFFKFAVATPGLPWANRILLQVHT